MWVLKVFEKQNQILRFKLDSIADVGEHIEGLNKARAFMTEFRYEVEQDLSTKR